MGTHNSYRPSETWPAQTFPISTIELLFPSRTEVVQSDRVSVEKKLDSQSCKNGLMDGFGGHYAVPVLGLIEALSATITTMTILLKP